jgi:trafficking protein particle complex subunit 6
MASSSSSSSVLAPLSDPLQRSIDGVAMDFFFIECVEALRDSSRVATTRAKKIEDEMVNAGLIPPPQPKKEDIRASTAGKAKTPLDEEEEDIYARLEAIGLHVGTNITERCEARLIDSSQPSLSALLDYVTIDPCSLILWTLSSLFARSCGPHVGTST